jgi:hypothetical protein
MYIKTTKKEVEIALTELGQPSGDEAFRTAFLETVLKHRLCKLDSILSSN